MKNNMELSVSEIFKLTYKKGKKLSESDSEMIPVFGTNGKRLGLAPRLICHRLGLIHKVVYLFITNENNEVLLQLRGDGRLDVAVGGHVSADDDSDTLALTRELEEEIGINVCDKHIEYVITYFKEAEANIKKPEEVNRELRVLYKLRMTSLELQMLDRLFDKRKDKGDVASIRWVSINEMMEYCSLGKAADGLKSSLPYYLKSLM